MKVQGYEKAWAALLTGGVAGAGTTLLLYGLSFINPEFDPGLDAVSAAIGTLVTAVFAAAGAYLATNSTPET